MVGLATVKPPDTKYPDEMAPYFTDTGASHQFTESYMRIFTEIILMGRYGVLIDAPLTTQGQPKLVPYIAENIVCGSSTNTACCRASCSANTSRFQGEKRFESVQICRYRDCHLVNGVYTVVVLDDDLEPTGPPVVPTFSGRSIDFIPFVPYGASGVHFDIDKPPMLDIARINISTTSVARTWSGGGT